MELRKKDQMLDPDGFEVCEIHPHVHLVQAQGELQDHCPICREEEESRIEDED